jgi:hypothetical protein
MHDCVKTPEEYESASAYPPNGVINYALKRIGVRERSV